MTNYKTIGDSLVADTIQDAYFLNQYDLLLMAYAKKVLKFDTKNSKGELDIPSLLFYADLLSKSEIEGEAEKHKLWGQEIVILLDAVFPGDNSIKYYMGEVLSEVGNFIGLSYSIPEYENVIFLSELRRIAIKNSLRIPSSTDISFLIPQKEIFKHFKERCFSYSAPTSLGKSFVIRMFIKDMMTKGEKLNFAIIVPSRALINEVNSKLIDNLENLLDLENYRIVNSAGATALDDEHNFIFVMTPERLLYLLIMRPDLNIDYLFVDEAHKISTKDSRSTFYYQTIGILSDRKHHPHIIFASPNVPNPEIYLNLVHGIKPSEKNKLTAVYSPVCQVKMLLDLHEGMTYYYNEHNKSIQKIAPLAVEHNLNGVLKFYGGKKLNLVYCDSPKKVVEYAQKYAETLPNLNDPELDALSVQIQDEIHEKYYLAQTIKKGVAYHMGNLPTSIRIKVEELFRGVDDGKGNRIVGKIHTLFCTSTLLEGVNLPADNLFVTSYKNGHKMSKVELANLMGRVGRIDLNLYGNVFLVCIPGTSNKKGYTDLLKSDIEPQTLSSGSDLLIANKNFIADSFKKGEFSIPCPPGMVEEDYDLLRKFSNILLRDIINGRDTHLVKEFSDVLNDCDIFAIAEKIGDKWKELDEDINTSFDQNEHLYKAIKMGSHYPRIIIGSKQKFDTVYSFICELNNIFDWPMYEPGTLGKKNKEGEQKQLKRYTVILTKWIGGETFRDIVSESLQFYGYKDEIKINEEVATLLNIIESIIQFRFANYFLKYSKAYKEIHPEDEHFQDWYEFVEYGTTIPTRIWLQKNGFSRDAATYIDLSKYVTNVSGEMTIKKSLLDCERSDIRREAKQVYFNNKKLFTD